MAFTVLNTTFTCSNCGEFNPELAVSCRNHCRKCLYSMHLDECSPGDRQSDCRALMPPVRVDHDGKKGWMIYHKCQKCGKIIPNKSAEDDNFDLIIELSSDQTPPKTA